MQLRRLDADPGGFRFVDQFILAAVAGDVGGGAAHVEADDRLPLIVGPGGHGIADHPPGRSGEDGPAAGEVVGRGEAAVRAHELEIAVIQFLLETVTEAFQIGADVRSQVGVNHGGVAPGHHFDHRHDPGRKRYLAETQVPGQAADHQFMLRPGVGVHEDHRQAVDAFFPQPVQLFSQHFQIWLPQDGQPLSGNAPDHRRSRRFLAVFQQAQALINFDDLFVKQFRFPDLQVEEAGTVLVADLQDVAESPGDQQGTAGSPALQQGVGGHRGTHADPFNPFRRQLLY